MPKSKHTKKSSNSAHKTVRKTVSRNVEKVIKKSPVLAIVLAIIIITAVVLGYFVYVKVIKNPIDNGEKPSISSESNILSVEKGETTAVTEGEISFHFLTLGNKNNGDSIYIKAGDTDILIDAGSRVNSVPTISQYIDNYVLDNTLEYVIVTHADRDHIAGFSGANDNIFKRYVCQTIIDFPLIKDETDLYSQYIKNRNKEVEDGGVRYSALECYNNENGAKRNYQLTDSISMEILYNYYYDHTSSDENNYSVCVLFRHDGRKFLFTGDLEQDGEERLTQYYNSELTQVELFKAGHHGSKTSSTNGLLSLIRPKICVASCVAGYNEYKAKPENVFPTQAFIDRIAPYTDRVYITSGYDGTDRIDYNGNVVVKSDLNGIKTDCSNNNKKLKDTSWFKENRNTPSSWVS